MKKDCRWPQALQDIADELKEADREAKDLEGAAWHLERHYDGFCARSGRYLPPAADMPENGSCPFCGESDCRSLDKLKSAMRVASAQAIIVKIKISTFARIYKETFRLPLFVLSGDDWQIMVGK